MHVICSIKSAQARKEVIIMHEKLKKIIDEESKFLKIFKTSFFMYVADLFNFFVKQMHVMLLPIPSSRNEKKRKQRYADHEIAFAKVMHFLELYTCF